MPYTDRDGFYYAVSQLNLQANAIRIYDNGFVLVNIEKVPIDTPVH
jgi:hypothetical protein